jgi:hypothetical protein
MTNKAISSHTRGHHNEGTETEKDIRMMLPNDHHIDVNEQMEISTLTSSAASTSRISKRNAMRVITCDSPNCCMLQHQRAGAGAAAQKTTTTTQHSTSHTSASPTSTSSSGQRRNDPDNTCTQTHSQKDKHNEAAHKQHPSHAAAAAAADNTPAVCAVSTQIDHVFTAALQSHSGADKLRAIYSAMRVALLSTSTTHQSVGILPAPIIPSLLHCLDSLGK